MEAKATHFDNLPEPWLWIASIPIGTSSPITEASESAPKETSA